MPASIPFSSQLPKFPDGKRRPGIIQLAKPLSTPPRMPVKLPGLNPGQKQPHGTQPATPNSKVPGLIAVSQLMTPSPSPRRQQNGHNKRRQKKSVGNIVVVPITNDDHEASLPSQSLDDVAARIEKQPVLLLSPPPTPAAKKAQRKAKPAPPVLIKAAAKGRRSTAAASPPTTPGINGVKITPVEGAVFPNMDEEAPLLPPGSLTQELRQHDGSDDSLPLADEDEVILWKQPPSAANPVDKAPAVANPAPLVVPRTPSPPTEFANWEDVEHLPPLSPATVEMLKEEFDIRPSKAFQERALLAMLKSSSSAPSTPGVAASYNGPSSSPIAIQSRPKRHGRTPSAPLLQVSGRTANYRADVADIFGLDIRDERAVAKAAEAWKAYAGSAFNVSPPDGEHATAPKPKFLSKLFA